jgi:predicted  nucleic acid-binding Zn-ribbon protein
MLPALDALIALQQADAAAEAARRQLAELPVREQAMLAELEAAQEAVKAASARLGENQRARRELEKDVATVESRLTRFEDHKAAVKTNQEYTALLHEIATAKGEKDGIEDRILAILEEADRLAEELGAAERAVVEKTGEAETMRASLGTERQALEVELQQLSEARAREAARLDGTLLGRYDQLLRQRKGLAVAPMRDEICTACHVRLRPHVAQQIRRNETIVSCESCQRILYFRV